MKTENIKTLLPAVMVLILLTAAGPVSAEDDISALKVQIEALQKRIDQLETVQSNSAASAPQSTSPFQNRGPVSWDPFEEMEHMQDEMNRMFQHSFSNPGFAGKDNKGMFGNNLFYDEDVNIQQTPEGYEVKFDMTGFDKDKVDIEVNGNSIAISGQRSSRADQSGKNGYYSTQSFGSFLKSVPVPPDADVQKMETKKEGDFLIIKMPRKKPSN